MQKKKSIYPFFIAILIWIVMSGFQAYSLGFGPQKVPKIQFNRILFSINEEPFSQWEMESFMIMSHIYDVVNSDNRSPREFQAINQKNWSRVLDDYMMQMTILIEVLRLSGYSSDEGMVEAQMNAYKEAIPALPETYKTLQKLGLMKGLQWEKDATGIVSHILRIRSYLKNKSSTSSESKDQWIHNLKDRSLTRMYKGAEGFRSLYQSSVQSNP